MLVDIAPVWTQPDAAWIDESTSTATRASSVGGSRELQAVNAIIGGNLRTTETLIFFG